MFKTREVAVVAVFSAAIIATDFALADLPNVKLLDSLVFVAAFVYGFRIGTAVAVTSELIWGVVSPYGFGAYIIPFLVLGELIYAAAGSIAARAWRDNLRLFSTRSIVIGSMMAVCAFIWDFQTNVGTAFIAFWPNVTLLKILATEGAGALFMVFHELSDFLLGAFVVPPVIVYVLRVQGRELKQSRAEMLVEAR